MCSSGGKSQPTPTPAAAPAPPAAPPEEVEIGDARDAASGYDDAPSLRVQRKSGRSSVAGSSTAGGSGLKM